jgi:hypothetical protein
MPKETAASEEVTAQQQRVAALFEALIHDLPAEPKDLTPEQAARWLLAHALDWHRREENVKLWEFFSVKDLSQEELYDKNTAVAGLSLRQRMPKMSPRERAPIDQYHYPAQECSIRPGDTLYTLDEQKFGDVVAVDLVARTVDVRKPIKLDGFHATAVFAYSRHPTDEQSKSILRLADWIVANGIDRLGDYRAAREPESRKKSGLPFRITSRLTFMDFLSYFALAIIVFVFLTLAYGIIAIHDIPYNIAKERNHPHQDAIHAAGWVSLFTLHAI